MSGKTNPQQQWVTALLIVAITLAAGVIWQRFRRPLHAVPPLLQVDDASSKGLPRLLVYTRTMGYRHSSIPAGVLALQKIGKDEWVTEHTEDPHNFTTENLARYQAVVFLSTTGDVLDEEQQVAFTNYINNGGSFIGVHAASDTEFGWPWYGTLVGARFRDHTKVIPIDIQIEVTDDISTRGLPNPWRHEDEWYAFKENPRGKVEVLASIDDTQTGEHNMGGDHPIAWKHPVQHGRSWYTALGHTTECFADANFLRHLHGGVVWAMHLQQGGAMPMQP